MRTSRARCRCGGDIASLNVIASKLNPSIGQSKQGWYNYLRLHEERDQGVDILNDIDWSYFWSHTPLDNPIINEKILPALSKICDQAFDGWDWGWQDTNRYIVQNYCHKNPDRRIHDGCEVEPTRFFFDRLPSHPQIGSRTGVNKWFIRDKL